MVKHQTNRRLDSTTIIIGSCHLPSHYIELIELSYKTCQRKDADSFHPKETILGLNINGLQKAYPFSELDKAGAIINDNVGKNEVVIDWNKDAHSATVSDMNGVEIPSIQGFYFA